jgi:hypothetical protein
LETPLLATAKKMHDGVYVHDIRPNETLSMFFARIYGEASTYTMDCSLFIQCASKWLTNWPVNGGPLILCVLFDPVATILFETEQIPEVGYVRPVDNEVFEFRQKCPTTAKGQWTLQSDIDQFLGLASEGIQTLSLSAWVSQLRSELHAYAQDKPRMALNFNEIMENSRKGIVDCYFKLHQMDTWGWYPKDTPRYTTVHGSDEVKVVSAPSIPVWDILSLLDRHVGPIRSVSSWANEDRSNSLWSDEDQLPGLIRSDSLWIDEVHDWHTDIRSPTQLFE